MLDILARSDNGATDEETLRYLVEHTEKVRRSAARGRAQVVAETEAVVRVAPHTAFSFDSTGLASLRAGAHLWQAGRFRLASIRELRSEAAAHPRGSGSEKLRMWVVDGGAAPTDIGSLQAHDGEGTLFQVASQFNCLEAPGPSLTSVAHYLSDPTQGPRAAISAFPGTLLRHYAAPDGRGGRFVQDNDGPQLQLLGDVCDPAFASVRNGVTHQRHRDDGRRKACVGFSRASS